MEEKKTAVLVVSFGTSYENTRKKTLDVIGREMQEAYPQWPFYQAWTSGMIRKKIQMRDGIFIPGVEQALEQMRQDGIRRIAVQPTHMVNGSEYGKLCREVSSVQDQFDRICIGKPLLTEPEDCDCVLEELASQIPVTEREALVLMGHGSRHYANYVYAALNYRLRELGHQNIYIGTVEAWSSLESVLGSVRRQEPEKVVLAPFLMVAGDHVVNDLAGEQADSWKSVFEAEGYQTECVTRGLGEYPGIRRILMEHLRETVSGLEGMPGNDFMGQNSME